ncbi:MAG: HAMP domain-containing histidine kinase [Lachnospiraceae bacterium]|nr:HAMP domain-containing histidine kinase [Lachnospiraceae bacterium]
MNKLKQRLRLPLAFAGIVFLTMLLANLVVLISGTLLARTGITQGFAENRIPLFQFSLMSIPVGTILAIFLSHLPLKPLREIMEATDKIASGDYSARLQLKSMPMKEFRDLSQRFNHMAEALNSVELLRADFVNNFSHEFKTPIVSIRGFAKMLKRSDLTPEEREEYLDIIIQESERLSELSANVLNLSRVEQQTILTDQKYLNLSEQLRLCIAMMDSKWPEKGILFQFDCKEVTIWGNEDLLQQVWLNLLDNAIKFSPDGGIVKIHLQAGTDAIQISIANQGKPIPEESTAHIFDRFYQADRSHTTKGNGLGLPLVRKIVQLHGGTVRLQSSDAAWTVFEVRLPGSRIG